MENIKYLAFYALLLVIIVLAAMGYHWLLIFPAAVVLSVAYIIVKGNDWKQVMGKAEMNSAVVFIGVLISQLVLAAICFGLGKLIGLIF
ncbi:hypothetical protein [Ostreibacterium oceani]|uniref:Uncharacterized protein n=1 Tax=Ostreibacterium oceani TaxID=2654998 RepID=A0A6N7EV35_9GAMM|nr:hypothetical protein [Ostreibacterium oceani]MPV85390.1 hypothetical protein [Ostreibacterium oceani]